ncbi:MAG TPA: BTAD domain-containing putative transcriptional regulator [Chloroflexota bacterium]
MAGLEVRLFGKFSVIGSGQAAVDLEACKAQELFSYLLLHRQRPHAREVLCELLWGNGDITQTRKHLRQALWQLHGALDQLIEPGGERILLIEPQWVRINSRADLWVDVNAFEQAYSLVEGTPGQELDANSVRILEGAVELYRGDLLEDWYHDWCLYDRERLQNLCLVLLDKLMAHCEMRGKYEIGLGYGERILRFDRARERTHRGMMRQQYLGGDRTGALRQYERCVAALDEELGIQPAKGTVDLYNQIRLDHLGDHAVRPNEGDLASVNSFSATLERIGRLSEILTGVQQQVQQLRQDLQTANADLDMRGDHHSVH